MDDIGTPRETGEPGEDGLTGREGSRKNLFPEQVVDPEPAGNRSGQDTRDGDKSGRGIGINPEAGCCGITDADRRFCEPYHEAIPVASPEAGLKRSRGGDAFHGSGISGQVHLIRRTAGHTVSCIVSRAAIISAPFA